MGTGAAEQILPVRNNAATGGYVRQNGHALRSGSQKEAQRGSAAPGAGGAHKGRWGKERSEAISEKSLTQDETNDADLCWESYLELGPARYLADGQWRPLRPAPSPDLARRGHPPLTPVGGSHLSLPALASCLSRGLTSGDLLQGFPCQRRSSTTSLVNRQRSASLHLSRRDYS